MLNTDARQMVPDFVPFSKRELHRIEVDITGRATNSSVYGIIKKKVEGIHIAVCGEAGIADMESGRKMKTIFL